MFTRPVRNAFLTGLVLFQLASCGGPSPDGTPSRSASADCRSIDAFYEARPGRQLWVHEGRLRPEGAALLTMLSEAGSDGLDSRRYDVAGLRAALASATPGEDTDRRLSAALVRYAEDLAAGDPDAPTYYVDEALRPRQPCASARLEQAAAAPSLAAWLAALREPNGVAASLRRTLARTGDPDRRAALARDLATIRAIAPARRFVLVDTTSARLWMIENGSVRSSMKVVVGRPGMDTPAMAGLIRFAVLNPYWNIPPDLVRNSIAPAVQRHGAAWLARRRLQPVTRYGSRAAPIEPAAISWGAVESGARRMRVRQLPGRDNMMGTVKFMMPNRLGIYLHDTPHRWVFQRANRHLSSGCVRLERAGEFYRWLFDAPLPAPDPDRPETRVPLRRPVPVYITRLSRGLEPLQTAAVIR